MSNIDSTKIQAFIHGQVACWNSGDKEQFFSLYKEVAPNGLTIEYVGRHQGDGFAILEGMWEQNQAVFRVEEAFSVYNGSEVACHNRNIKRDTGECLDTIEIYHFKPGGEVHVRYFVNAG